jgi:hypothetical protein
MSNRNVWKNDPYVYGSTSSGVNVYSSTSGSKIAEASTAAGANAVWADDDYFYIATTNAGIQRVATTNISGNYNLTPFIVGYKSFPNITSDQVIYLHGAGDFLCATTASGVDHFNTTSGTRIYTTSVSNPTKCAQASSGEFYYVDGNLKAVYDYEHNWSTPDYAYVIGDMIPVGVTINDLALVEGTNNLILLATTSGAVVIEENKYDEENSRYRRYFRRNT